MRKKCIFILNIKNIFYYNLYLITKLLVTETEVERVDINLLGGQTLKMRISNVESILRFYVQLPSASKCEKIVDQYMADKNAEVLFSIIYISLLRLRFICYYIYYLYKYHFLKTGRYRISFSNTYITSVN